MSRRLEKVAALLKREVSMLVRDALPEEMGMVSLTAVDLTSDLKEAKVYISIFDQEKEKEILAILDEKLPQIQQILGRKLTMKFTPKIHFLVDHYQDKIDKVDAILKEIKNGS